MYLRYAQIHFRPRLRPDLRWGSLRRSPRLSSRMVTGEGDIYSPYFLPRIHFPLDAFGVSISAPYAVVTGPRDNGFPGTNVALDGPVRQLTTRLLKCRTHLPETSHTHAQRSWLHKLLTLNLQTRAIDVVVMLMLPVDCIAICMHALILYAP